MTSTVQESSQDLRFPTGKFHRPAELDAVGRANAIEIIAATPARLRAAVSGLTDEQHRDAVPARRVDRAAGRAPRARQSPQRATSASSSR